MSAVGQVRTRSNRATRGNKAGFKLDELLSAFGFSCIFDSMKDVTLNGTDVSALGDQAVRYPRSFDHTGYTISQGTAGLQPLSTGAPVYGNQTSIQFLKANGDTLQRANTNIIATGDKTFFLAQRLRNAAGTSQMVLSNESVGTTTGMGAGYGSTGLRDIHNAAISNEVFGTPSTAAAEIWVCRKPTSELSSAMVNNAAVAVSGGFVTDTSPGAAGLLALGDIAAGWDAPDMDFLFGAIAVRITADSVGYLLTKTCGAQIGLTVT